MLLSSFSFNTQPHYSHYRPSLSCYYCISQEKLAHKTFSEVCPMVWTVFPNSLGKGAWTHFAQTRHFPQSHATKPRSEQQLLPLVDLKGKSSRSTARLETISSIQAAPAFSEINQWTHVGNINGRIKNYLPKTCFALDRCKCNMNVVIVASHYIFTSITEGRSQLIKFYETHTQASSKIKQRVDVLFREQHLTWHTGWWKIKNFKTTESKTYPYFTRISTYCRASNNTKMLTGVPSILITKRCETRFLLYTPLTFET